MIGLVRHLDDLLGSGTKQWRAEEPHWSVRSLLGVWYRPNFDGFFVSTGEESGKELQHTCSRQYPYKPAHVSQPKECKKIYLVTMTERE